jgi:ABC-type multidrug transport system fused ATPase/permease subunit
MLKYSDWKKEKDLEANNIATDINTLAIAKKILQSSEITEDKAREVLTAFDFPLHKAKAVKDKAEAVEFAESIGYPIALKIISPQIIHKSDVGGVALNIENSERLESAIDEMIKKISANQPEAKIEGFLVGEMITGNQVILGLKQDPQFGPVIMLGMGGIYTEIFKDVSFRYGNEESPLILNKVNSEIRAGQIVALVGRSGSGKTTMVQLVNRLFEPFDGKVLIDGYDVKHYPLTELRRIIAVVTQDSKLFSGSVLDNISIGDQFTDIKKAIDAAVLAGADSFIRQHPEGYFRPLMEDGAGLSGGQKQRISIARALYRNPKHLLPRP